MWAPNTMAYQQGIAAGLANDAVNAGYVFDGIAEEHQMHLLATQVEILQVFAVKRSQRVHILRANGQRYTHRRREWLTPIPTLLCRSSHRD